MTISSLMSDLLADYDSRGLSLRSRGWKWADKPMLSARGRFRFRLDNGCRLVTVFVDTNPCPYGSDAGMKLWLRDTLDLEILWRVSQ